MVMEQYSETEKQVYAILLAVGLFYVFARVAYQYLTKERFTLYNIFHPVQRIKSTERHFIGEFLIPFRQFSPDQKRKFLKRFAWFKSKKPFVFYGEIENKDEIKAYVTASAVLVTMGMKDFRFERSISRVIVYPSKYYSKIAKRHHIGEYNPRLKVLVFSAEGLKEGYRIPNDNINLGIHEIAHALMFENKNKSTWEGMRFKVGLARLKVIFESPEFQQSLKNSEYFRAYAQTNFFEFFAILVESFFESPEQLELYFPRMYNYLQRMLNYGVKPKN